jgi:UDP-N-acetylglucosamine 3-dehydrogenase
VIGLGKMGKLHFLNASHMNDVKVVAVADKNKRNRKVAEKHHVKTYDDYEKLVDSEELDAVIISLPNFLKRESIFYATEKGLDIFVDKPLARNLAEAQEIVRKVNAENVRLMVGVNYRYFDSVQKVKKMLDEGIVGDVVIATSELIMDGPFSHPLVPKPVPEWWFDKEKAGGGALLDLGYHLIDLFNWMFGDLKIEFSNLGYRFGLPIEDSATVVIKSTKNGVNGIVNAGWFSKMIFPNFNFRINLNGTVGYASTDHFAPRNLYLHAIKEATLNFFRRAVGKRVHYLSYTYYYASFFKVLDQFFEAIREDTSIPVSPESQLEVIKAIETVYRQNRGFVSE